MMPPTDTLDTQQNGDSLLFCWDSVFGIPDQSLLPCHKSLFSDHSMPVKHSEPLPRVQSDDGGYVFAVCILLVIAFLIFAILRKFQIKNVLAAAFSSRHTNILMRDSGLKNDFSMWPASLIYYSSVATAAYVATSDIFDIHLFGMADLPILIGVTLLFIFLRHILTKLLGIASGEKDTVAMYTITGTFFQLAGATLVIPATIAARYADTSFVWFAAAIAALVFVLRLARGLSLVLSKSGGFKLYLFYYLCIIEIIPLLIFTKLIINNM